MRELPTEATEALAAGRKIEAIKIVRSEWGVSLKEALEAVESHLQSPPQARTGPSLSRRPGPRKASPADRALPTSATVALAAGRKLDAIKIVRSEWGIDLKEAREAVDSYINSQPGLAESMRSSTASGGRILLWIVIAAAIVAVYYWVKRL